MKLDILLTSKVLEDKLVEEAKDAMQGPASSVENVGTTNFGGPSSAAFYEPQDNEVIGGSDQKSCVACTFLSNKWAMSCSICGGS